MKAMLRKSRILRLFRCAGHALLVSAALALLPCIAAAQNVNDGFDPNANGEVDALFVQPDGKILVGGQFTALDASTRNHLARLNADGSNDMIFVDGFEQAVLFGNATGTFAE